MTDFDVTRQRFRETCKFPLTVDAARECVSLIRELAIDDEVAHVCEDELWEVALRTITDIQERDGGFAAALSAVVRQTQMVEFSRWCA